MWVGRLCSVIAAAIQECQRFCGHSGCMLNCRGSDLVIIFLAPAEHVTPRAGRFLFCSFRFLW
jgi:hypothetical protein